MVDKLRFPNKQKAALKNELSILQSIRHQVSSRPGKLTHDDTIMNPDIFTTFQQVEKKLLPSLSNCMVFYFSPPKLGVYSTILPCFGRVL